MQSILILGIVVAIGAVVAAVRNHLPLVASIALWQFQDAPIAGAATALP